MSASKPAPRRFVALARPQGDLQTGTAGPLVEILIRDPALRLERVMVFTRAEAEALCAELRGALRAFALAEHLAEEVAADIAQRPRPYLGPYPARGPSLAEVW